MQFSSSTNSQSASWYWDDVNHCLLWSGRRTPGLIEMHDPSVPVEIKAFFQLLDQIPLEQRFRFFPLELIHPMTSVVISFSHQHHTVTSLTCNLSSGSIHLLQNANDHDSVTAPKTFHLTNNPALHVFFGNRSIWDLPEQQPELAAITEFATCLPNCSGMQPIINLLVCFFGKRFDDHEGLAKWTEYLKMHKNKGTDNTWVPWKETDSLFLQGHFAHVSPLRSRLATGVSNLATRFHRRSGGGGPSGGGTSGGHGPHGTSG